MLSRKELDSQYHFSCQFTADLIAMNTADFIITSTYQEVGTLFNLLIPLGTLCL
jgi:hypothetical protein